MQRQRRSGKQNQVEREQRQQRVQEQPPRQFAVRIS
jgi:hypothetical protein